MEKEENILTEEGRLELIEELNHLKNVVRPEVISELNEARAQGDLSENADYDAARNKQAEVEGRISELEHLLSHSKIIKSDKSTKVVSVGCKVELISLDVNETDTYSIVGSAEADPFNGKISNECLLAQAILGHKVGETVTVKCDNPYQVKINKIIR